MANAVEHADETLQSLQFGSRAMHVQTKAVVNESLGSKLLNADLLAKLANLEIMSPCLVDASLLAKEEELERIQEALLVSPPPFNVSGQDLCCMPTSVPRERTAWSERGVNEWGRVTLDM